MKQKRYTMNIFHPGGNASKEAKAYKISIPTRWAQTMGFTTEDRTALLTFEDGKIIIEKEKKSNINVSAETNEPIKN